MNEDLGDPRSSRRISVSTASAHPIEIVDHDPERADGPLQDRGEGDVEVEAGLGYQACGAMRLGDPGRRQVDVGPAGESVVAVPGALTVPKQDQLAFVATAD